MIKRILLRVLGGSLILFFCVVAELQAQVAPHLVISEVQITGGEGKTKNDFVEIYNSTDSSIDLSGIRLVKRTKSGTTDKTIILWESETLVPAHGYYLWANSGFTDIATAPDSTNDEYISDDNGIALRQGAENTGEIIDAVAWGAAENIFKDFILFVGKPGVNESIEREIGTNNFFRQTNPNPQNSGTAGSTPNDPEIELPNIHAGEVVINEIVPNPSDGAEWVEFYNNTASAINLEGCKIYDGTGSAVLLLSGNVAGQGFFVAELSSARLNNTGDLVVLKNAQDEIIDQVAYGSWDDGQTADNAPNPSAGQSVARKSNGVDTNHDNIDFAVSDQVTYGTSNIIHATTTKTQGGTNVSANLGTVPLPKIVINEFVVGSEKEAGWAELYIGGEVSMDMEDWYLENGAENKTSLSGVLIPGQFKVIEKINGALNSKGDIIRLKNKDGQVYDSVSYGVWEDGKPSDNAPAAQSPFSVARIKDGSDTNNDKKDFAMTSAATKGSANKIEKVEVDVASRDQVTTESDLVTKNTVDVVEKLFINEVLPNPAGSDDEEWVELFWESGAPLDLAGFSIDDKEGGSKPFVISNLVIEPNEYALLKREITKLAFNNDTDEARLFDKDGQLIDEVEYEEGAEGLAYARGTDGVWGWTSQPTPGALNIIEVPSPSPLPRGEGGAQPGEGYHTMQYVTLSKVRDLELGTNIQVKGVVAVLPGVLGTQIFYIIDGSSGLQVYSNKKAFPKMELGDVVQVTGVLSQAQGETRVKTKTADDILVISKDSAPMAREFIGEEIGENQEGGLIKIQGTIIDKTSAGFVVAASFGEVPIIIKKTAGINVREIIPGLQVVITGIVGNSIAGYRIMPRFQEDIEVVGMDELATGLSNVKNASKENTPYAKATAYVGGGVALAALGIRRRKLFINGARAVLFLIGKSNGRGKGLI